MTTAFTGVCHSVSFGAKRSEIPLTVNDQLFADLLDETSAASERSTFSGCSASDAVTYGVVGGLKKCRTSCVDPDGPRLHKERHLTQMTRLL